MATEKTWQWALNVPFGGAGTAAEAPYWWVWWLKEALIGNVTLYDASGAAIASPGGLWTMAQCSDGVSVDTTGVDLFAGAFDASKFVRAPNGTAHSWILLRNASLGMWVLWDFGLTSSQQIVTYAFVDTPTTGTVGTRPYIVSPAGILGNTGGLSLFSTTTVGRRAHLLLSTDGSFVAMHSENGSGKIYTAHMVHKLADIYTDDTHSDCMVYVGNAFRSGYDFFADGAYINDRVGGYVTASGVTPYVRGASLLAAGIAPDPDGKLLTFPLRVSSGMGNKNIKGRIPDILMCPQTTDDTALVPATGTPTGWLVGQCLMPLNGTVPSL